MPNNDRTNKLWVLYLRNILEILEILEMQKIGDVPEYTTRPKWAFRR